MCSRSSTALFGLAVVFASSRAVAQPDLPPPPPPPLGQTTDLPARPPGPEAPRAPTVAPASGRASVSVRRAPAPALAQPPPSRLPPHRATRLTVFVPDEKRRLVAVTLNPLPLAVGRLGGNVEVEIVRHHAIVGSLTGLVGQVGRGGRYSLVSEGFGFASAASTGFGVEIGYHHWWGFGWCGALCGVFFGPSFLAGSTTQATVGDPSQAQAYWGGALDIGGQEVFRGGLTVGFGAGAGVMQLAGSRAVFPRLLFQVGWSF